PLTSSRHRRRLGVGRSADHRQPAAGLSVVSRRLLPACRNPELQRSLLPPSHHGLLPARSSPLRPPPLGIPHHRARRARGDLGARLPPRPFLAGGKKGPDRIGSRGIAPVCVAPRPDGSGLLDLLPRGRSGDLLPP